jgi:hypothetical protein
MRSVRTVSPLGRMVRRRLRSVVRLWLPVMSACRQIDCIGFMGGIVGGERG